MRATKLAVQVNIDLDVKNCRLILAAHKRQLGEEDGEAEGMRDTWWFVFRIGFDAG